MILFHSLGVNLWQGRILFIVQKEFINLISQNVFNLNLPIISNHFNITLILPSPWCFNRYLESNIVFFAIRFRLKLTFVIAQTLVINILSICFLIYLRAKLIMVERVIGFGFGLNPESSQLLHEFGLVDIGFDLLLIVIE